MRLEPAATRFQSEKSGVKHTFREQHFLNLQKGCIDRIEREVTENRISKSNLHRSIDSGEVKLIGSKRVYGACLEIPTSRNTSSPKAIVSGLMSCPKYQPSLSSGIRAEPRRIGPQPMSSTVEQVSSHGFEETKAAFAGVQSRFAAAHGPCAPVDHRETHPAYKDFLPESSRYWG